MLDIPFIDLPPFLAAGGTVHLPGSKSISNRVLLLAGLCDGETLVGAPLAADDTRVMLAALETLGCRVTPDGGDLRIAGFGAGSVTRVADLFLGNAGTAMRPFTAVLAVLAATRGGSYRLDGVPRMRERPIGDLVDALRRFGCRIEDLGEPGFPPVAVRGEAGGRLDLEAPVRVRGDVSSQFLTALLLALPLADAGRPVTIEVEGELVSKPYVEITLELMRRFGVEVARDAGRRRFTIAAGSRYRSPGRVRVEGDASSASYFIALGAIAGFERPVRIEGVGLDSIQGDIRFVDAARAMGAAITGGDGWLESRRGAWPLKAVSLDAVAIPDAAMTLAAMALFADGTTRIGGIANWRVKETDRIAAMADGLRRLGAHVVEGADFLEIAPPARWQPARIPTFDDHRIAMCFSLAAFNALSPSSRPGGWPVRILEPHCVAKTFPDYFESLLSVVEADPLRVPVLTVDGPTASGKGTLAAGLARRLGYRLLDSGALYRLTALAAMRRGTALDDAAALAAVAAALDVLFADGVVRLEGDDVTDAIRSETVGMAASAVSALRPVRDALLARQRSFRRAPGLVADGRDMGTVVFPDAELKVFLVADASERAARRHAQLISRGVPANIDSLRADLEARDARDRNRSASPLEPGADAKLLDNSSLSIALSVDRVIGWWEARPDAMKPFASGR